jgi:hypothetical protein
VARVARLFRAAAIVLGAGTILLVVFLLIARAMLLRDAEPRILARRTTIASARESEIVRSGAVTDQDVVVTGENGLRADYRARRKAEVIPGERLPLLLLLGGHMRGKEATAFIPDPRNAIVVSIAYPFDGNERVTGVAVAGEVPAIRRALFDTAPAVMLALDHLLNRPDVDTTRVELVGASFGVPFAAIAGALDPRVTRVWLVQGGGDPYALLLTGLKDEVGFMPARKAVAGLANTLASGPRLAPEAWVGRIAPRPVVMINTQDDERIPRASAELLHAAAREPKEVVWLPGLHMQPNRPDVLGALIDAVFERIETPKPGTPRR